MEAFGCPLPENHVGEMRRASQPYPNLLRLRLLGVRAEGLLAVNDAGARWQVSCESLCDKREQHPRVPDRII